MNAKPEAQEWRIRGGRKAQALHPEIRNNGRGKKTIVDGQMFPSMAQAAMWTRLAELGGDPFRESELPPIDTPEGTYYPDTILRKEVLGIPAGVPLELKAGNGEWLWNLAQIWAVENGEAYLVCRKDFDLWIAEGSNRSDANRSISYAP